MLRTPVKMVAAALAAGAVLTACGGPVKLGAAAVMTNDRISASTLSAEVANLNQNYLKYKGKVQLQYEVSQMPQEVLSWLIRFRVRDEMAVRNGISVTPGQVDQAELQQINKQSQSSRPPAFRCRCPCWPWPTACRRTCSVTWPGIRSSRPCWSTGWTAARIPTTTSRPAGH